MSSFFLQYRLFSFLLALGNSLLHFMTQSLVPTLQFLRCFHALSQAKARA
jgi:hypothetical protein